MKENLYFAYGSNINLEQMKQRCPEAQAVCPVTLENYRLAFRGNVCGVATILPEKGSQVQGMLWKLTTLCERSLDRYEGYPNFYGKQEVTVKAEGVEPQIYSLMHKNCSYSTEQFLKNVKNEQRRREELIIFSVNECVMAYVMNPPYKELAAWPSRQYINGIAQGYQQNGMSLKSLADAYNRTRQDIAKQAMRHKSTKKREQER